MQTLESQDNSHQRNESKIKKEAANEPATLSSVTTEKYVDVDSAQKKLNIALPKKNQMRTVENEGYKNK